MPARVSVTGCQMRESCFVWENRGSELLVPPTPIAVWQAWNWSGAISLLALNHFENLNLGFWFRSNKKLKKIEKLTKID
jgi:hypothetical protein